MSTASERCRPDANHDASPAEYEKRERREKKQTAIWREQRAHQSLRGWQRDSKNAARRRAEKIG